MGTLENGHKIEALRTSAYQLAIRLSEILSFDNIRTCMRNVLRALEYSSPMLGSATIVRHFMQCPPEGIANEECIDDDPDDYPFPSSQGPEVPDCDCGESYTQESTTRTENDDAKNNSASDNDQTKIESRSKGNSGGKFDNFTQRRGIVEICEAWDELPLPLIGIVLAPFILLTCYLFYDWHKTRKLYLRRKADIREYNYRNRELQEELDKLEAYNLSFQMFRLVVNEERMKAQQMFTTKSGNIKELGRQCEALKEERSILREVLRRINSPDADRAPKTN